MSNLPDEFVARIIHEALEQLGWQNDAISLTRIVQGLNKGLPTEDEFSVILSWLGNCRLVHKLDQFQTPSDSKNTYRVPDLLAIFTHDGKDIPVLIEVKQKQGQTLSWRPDYYEPLRNYGHLLDMPVLVAWKFNGLWTLFELTHFTKANKNYNINFETAMKESLMGILAGDFMYSLYEGGVGLHFQFTKDELIEEKQKEDGISTQEWLMTLEEIYFTNGENRQMKHVPSEIIPLIFSYSLEETTNTSDTHIIQSFVVTNSNSVEFAHTGLVRLIDFFHLWIERHSMEKCIAQ